MSTFCLDLISNSNSELGGILNDALNGANRFMFLATLGILQNTERSLSLSTVKKNVADINFLVVFLVHKAAPYAAIGLHFLEPFFVFFRGDIALCRKKTTKQKM